MVGRSFRGYKYYSYSYLRKKSILLKDRRNHRKKIKKLPAFSLFFFVVRSSKVSLLNYVFTWI